ncbi:MAG: hypothetical protein OXG72_16675 [Acidobacteria bacterium]|nr:hypothetical protein [Acidobacteriota bacterium]
MRNMRCSFADLRDGRKTPAWLVMMFIEDFNARNEALAERNPPTGDARPGTRTVVTDL